MVRVSSQQAARMMRSEDGSVFMMVGLIVFLLIMAVGVAVDMAREEILQQRLTSALDAAGLAAAETVSTPPSGVTNLQWAQQEVDRYFAANFPAGYLASTVPNPTVTLSDDLDTMQLSVTASQKPMFMQTFGFSALTVSAQSQVTRSNNGEGMELVLVLDNTGSMNGTLPNQSTTKIQALGTAVNSLINILFGANTSVPNLFVGIVPFSESVNVPLNLQNGGWMDPLDPNLSNWTDGNSWGGCLTSRSSTTVSTTDPAVNFGSGSYNMTLDISDDTPATAKFDEYFYTPVTPTYSYALFATLFNKAGTTPPDTANSSGYVNFNPWGPGPNSNTPPTQYVDASTFNLDTVVDYHFDRQSNGAMGTNMGPNAFCAPVVTPMTALKSDLVTAINNLTATTAVGDTMINLGLAWGWRMLSPNWQGWWNSATMTANSLPLAYNTTNSQKVLILMTDGTNFILPGAYSAYGFMGNGNLDGTTTSPDPIATAADLDNRTLAVCQSLKNNGVTIFTIGFGSAAPDSPPTLADRMNSQLVDVPLLQECATSANYFFLAPTNAQLQAAFQQIGNTIENIRISK